jgi:hypothetical protein
MMDEDAPLPAASHRAELRKAYGKHKQQMINGAEWEQNCGETKEGERAQLPGKQQQQQQRRINVKYERKS